MSKNITAIPYTELVERVMGLARVAPNEVEKVRGIIQDVYTREIPAKHDWNFLIVSSSFVTIADYDTGTATINTDATAVTFSSDVSLTAGFTGRKIKFSNNDAVYDFTFSNSTGGTVTPALQGNSNISSGAYKIFQPFYALAPDFDRFPKEGGVYKWQGGRKEILKEESFQEYTRDYRADPGVPERIRLVGTDTIGTQLIELRPAPSEARVYGYDYIHRLPPLTESTAGFILSISANATAVNGQTSARFNEATTGDYLRVDVLGKGQNSSWYRIRAIANDSSLTLVSTFANTAILSSASYALSKAPEIPEKLHPAVLYGALRALTLDQNDPAAAFYNTKMAEVLSDGKRIYVSRVYNQEIETVFQDYQYRR